MPASVGLSGDKIGDHSSINDKSDTHSRRPIADADGIDRNKNDRPVCYQSFNPSFSTHGLVPASFEALH